MNSSAWACCEEGQWEGGREGGGGERKSEVQREKVGRGGGREEGEREKVRYRGIR